MTHERNSVRPYSALYGDAAALCGGLADGGLPVDERRVRDIKRYFRSVEVDARVTRVTRTGWHEICGKKVFVLPGGTIGNDSSEVVMLDGSDKAPYEANGTIDSWRNNIAKPAGDHLLLRLAISTALAGRCSILLTPRAVASISTGRHPRAKRRCCA